MNTTRFSKSFRLSLLGICALGFSSTAAVADHHENKKGVYTDPGHVDADYAVQGEYTGVLEGDKWGAQVIALGSGKFDVVAYPGGLPGDGWDGDKSKRRKANGATKDGATIFKTDKWTATLKDGTITVVDADGNAADGELKRVVRKSPTLGAKPPKGAVVLFDGKNADAFKGSGMTESGLLKQGQTSKQLFQDFSIHLEFRTPYQPAARGQGRGNSGFYAQGRYEIQVLDSFGLEGKGNECGGIYSISEPKLNMCYPPLQWQTYDADFTAARYDESGKKIKDSVITVKHNGVTIHENLKCDHSTTASPLKEGPQPGPVYFQNHGNPVRFQNIWVVEKK